MELTREQLSQYQSEGFLLLEDQFSQAEIDVMRAEIPVIFAQDSPARVLEKGSSVVRSVYGPHATNQIYGWLSRHPRVAGPAMQILDHSIYLYQFKINAKAAFVGDTWEWHQDFIFWHKEDGLPRPAAINAAVYLDEVNEFNGPMFLIPRSHKYGMIDVEMAEKSAEKKLELNRHYSQKPNWISNLTATLKYSLPKEVIQDLVLEHGIAAPKGRRGSVLFFDCNAVHSSAANMSPFDRMLALASYNRTDNLPTKLDRPDFLVSRDFTPLNLVSDDVFTSAHQVAAHG
jgi:ectoine hydroxylase-related dioxygenase (phytanoyl-CoA dioxygenase family)